MGPDLLHNCVGICGGGWEWIVCGTPAFPSANYRFSVSQGKDKLGEFLVKSSDGNRLPMSLSHARSTHLIQRQNLKALARSDAITKSERCTNLQARARRRLPF